MKKDFSQWLKHKIVIGSSLLFACMFTEVFGQDKPMVQPRIFLQKQDLSNLLVLGLENQLSQNQLKLIQSGFSTISQVVLEAVAESNEDDEDKDDEKPVAINPESVLMSKNCSVQYDTWDEIYFAQLLDESATLMTFQTLDDFLKECFVLKVPQELHQRMQESVRYKITIQIRQISEEQAQAMRQWLVKQQSNVMKGLFSHMLGELVLSYEKVIWLERWQEILKASLDNKK